MFASYDHIDDYDHIDHIDDYDQTGQLPCSVLIGIDRYGQD